MHTALKILIIVLLTFIISCTPRFNFDRIIIPVTPVNFFDVNSSYDDYNSAEPQELVWYSFSLFFSTNRYNMGRDFDVFFYECNIESNFIDGVFQIHAYPAQTSLTDSINSQYNELGPYFTYDTESYLNQISDQSDKRFFYTSDVNGNSDIFYILYSNNSYYSPAGNPVNLEGINTAFNDGYLTIHPDEYQDRETVYFTSDRDGSFDIYRAVSEENKLIHQSSILEINKVEQLSTNADDKCPFIRGNVIVFASDRAGGLGGYDLWYSTYKDNEWSAPDNFGETINTEYNEFRPVIIVTWEEEFYNNLMIFSSDRPGGKGMFDLYYVGINQSAN